MKYTAKFSAKKWAAADKLVITLQKAGFARVKRESLSIAGLPVGYPVKILNIDAPKESFRHQNQPYVRAFVELPNGETRGMCAEALELTPKDEVAFHCQHHWHKFYSADKS